MQNTQIRNFEYLHVRTYNNGRNREAKAKIYIIVIIVTTHRVDYQRTASISLGTKASSVFLLALIVIYLRLCHRDLPDIIGKILKPREKFKQTCAYRSQRTRVIY